MTRASWEADLTRVRDASLEPAVRRAAAQRLGGADDEWALDALCELATRAELPDTVSRAVGASAARVGLKVGRLPDALLPDFTGPAYLGYDEAVTALQD